MHLYHLYKLNLCCTASPLCIFINSTNWICVGQLHRNASLSPLQIKFMFDSFTVMHLYQLYKLNLCWTASPLCIFINSTNWICVGQLHRNVCIFTNSTNWICVGQLHCYASLSTVQIEFVLDSFIVMHLCQLYKLNLCWTAPPLYIFINSSNLLGELQTVGDPIDNRCCSYMKNKHPGFKLRKKELRRNFIAMGTRKP